MCGISVKEKDEKELIKLKVKDSKLLTKLKREQLFDKIKDISYKYEVISVYPDEVDKAVNGDDGLNLNKLEARKTAEILNLLKPDKAIIDAPSNNIKSYKEYVMGFIRNKKIELILEHKADLNFPVVSAASIIAKVTRDNEIEKIKKRIKIDFGSGYPSDPKTISFLEKYHEKHSKIFRKSWMPYQKIANKKFQKKLEDFSQFIEKVEHKDKEIVEKLKILEDFGYKFIPTSTEHEHVRMKGSCTITLYKNGKLLIQGKEENKKTVERLIANKK
ncbi:ribonuclease HII [Candidatus Woesearchaeota archaeon]|nr:ribonuclease HII [Candidatus Woesearchaeota archaeon]|tara:strand:+ start:1685 stop:2506 length:822 start_codon:yes stop_codon:yes gene_type:complete